MPVHPEVEAVAGLEAYKDIASLPEVPDLAVICTPASTVPRLIAQLGDRLVKAAIVITAGLGRQRDDHGRTLLEAALDAARPHTLRLLGPNCVGLIMPPIGLNASFAHASAKPGHLAFVSQSGALCTAVLDWARSKGIGFSHLISLGDCADVDFGDCINYLSEQRDVHAILLYIESIREARKFMSAARSAARNKPVLAVKAGRVEQGARAAASHTGAIAGADDVYEAAIRRAGMLRLLTIAVQTWGDVIEDRGSQITFSALGQQAPIEEKIKWDPDFAKRKKIKMLLDQRIPEFSVRLGGMTSVDVTLPGIDKAYGIRTLRDILGIAMSEMVFVGDALFPGGNDYPVEEAGVDSIQVKDPHETKRVIEAIVPCLGCGQDAGHRDESVDGQPPVPMDLTLVSKNDRQ
jgi:succinyl-CoA synthetase alpha subunit